MKAQAEALAASASLASDGVYGRVLDEPETRALLGLLDLALVARVPVSSGVGRSGSSGSSARSHGVRLTLVPCAGSTTVATVRGRLYLDGLRLEVAESAAGTRSAAQRAAEGKTA